MTTPKIRIRLKAYDPQAARSVSGGIVDTAKRTVPRWPGRKSVAHQNQRVIACCARRTWTRSRARNEIRTHKRLLDILEPNAADPRRAHEAQYIHQHRRRDQDLRSI